VIHYTRPLQWIRYRWSEIAGPLAEAKAAVLALQTMPYQRAWVEGLQQMQLKLEVAGTSRIEGAEFSERELEAALGDTPEGRLTRSQRQAAAALATYRWISTIPSDRPVDSELFTQVHRRIVTNADDDHCPPGQLRGRDQNVTFGTPPHRGCEGGEECGEALESLLQALRGPFRDHDPLLQALAFHYHVAAMHPFLDGNGRTARACEALLLQRAGLSDRCFVAMSNFYYEEKSAYLGALAQVRADEHDLTAFLQLGLRGVSVQSRRLLDAIRHQMKKALFRNVMIDLFERLKTPRKRVIARRQRAILELLLEEDGLTFLEIYKRLEAAYVQLTDSFRAFIRDVVALSHLGALHFDRPDRYTVNLDWPTEITESEFFERLKTLPRTKSLVHPGGSA
jgi:cell filamentation protein, protein adenylyltransferase